MSSRFHTNVLVVALVAISAITAGCSSKTGGHASAAGAQPSSSSSHMPGLGDSTGSSSASPSQASSSPAATASPSATPSYAPPKATITGWQPVGDHVRKIAYDAPPGFKLLDPSAPLIIGTDKRLQMFAGSLYREGFCPTQSGLSRATAGVASAFQGSMDQVAHTLARFFAREVFETGAKHPKLTISKPKALKVAGTHAVEAQAVVTKAAGGKCGAPKAIADVVVVDGGGSNGIFVLLADQGVQSAISTNTINKIIGSVRRIP
jgi:hypothetical protein